ncbi:hypothetical protein BDA99DRAFT_317027 [Phascolomyces articulosus]|uniref:Uncharacterized protein n=1 Tax=Phascolomyces articulosus TaxID=60185 RepID=A0AAD5JLB2_9FUNG|nr:hypothetical protein BDA99DRAFT_317027 [Phascolomyces articulosus]
MKITWNNLTATTTTKMELFKGFGFSTSKKSRRLNETKMAILATLCGNDYAPKYPNLPIARLVHILKHMKSPAKEDLYADLFMEQVIEKINKDSTIAKPKNKKNINTQRFNIALHQFCMPQVTGVTLEDNEKLCCYYDALPINKNESILHQLGNEFDLLPWSKNDHSLIENTPTLRKRQQELLLLQQQQKNTISNDTLSSIQQQSATTSIQPLVQITFNKSSIMSLLASSKAHIFTLSALVICYFPLLFFLFYIYMVIIIFLCMSFILSSSTTNPTSSSSKKIHSK